MTLEQEIKLAAKHAAEKAAKEAAEKAYEKGYREACEKFDKKDENVYKKAQKEAEIEKVMVIKKAAEEKLESARKMKSKNIPDDVIAECLGLSLEQVQVL